MYRRRRKLRARGPAKGLVSYRAGRKRPRYSGRRKRFRTVRRRGYVRRRPIRRFGGRVRARPRRSKASRFGRRRSRKAGRFGAFPYRWESIDSETISSSYHDNSSGLSHPGIGIQTFNDFRSLGEKGTLYSVYNDAVVSYSKKLIAHPLGPKAGGHARTPPFGGWPIQTSMPTTPDIVTRLDPNTLRVRLQESIRYTLYNVGNTIAYCTVYQYIPKVVTHYSNRWQVLAVYPNTYRPYQGNDPSGNSSNSTVTPIPFNTDCTDTQIGTRVRGTTLPWYYPPLGVFPGNYLESTQTGPAFNGNSPTWPNTFAPVSYDNNLLRIPRLYGASQQIAPIVIEPDFRQDIADNMWNLQMHNPAYSRTDVGVIDSNYYAAGGSDFPTISTGPAINGIDYNNAGMSFGGTWTGAYDSGVNPKINALGGGQGSLLYNPWVLMTNPTFYGTTGGGGVTGDALNTGGTIQSFSPVGRFDVEQGYNVVDYSQYPAYKEEDNATIRQLFAVKSRRLTVCPGQTATWTVRNPPCTIDAVKHGLLDNGLYGYGQNLWPLAPMQSGVYGGPINALATRTDSSLGLLTSDYMNPSYTPVDDVARILGTSKILVLNPMCVEANDLMRRGAGDPTTTKPMSICIRGQTVADNTLPNAMQIMPAVCALKKHCVVRYNVFHKYKTGVKRHRTVVNNLSNKASLADLSRYKMQFPIVTDSAQVISNAGAYP